MKKDAGKRVDYNVFFKLEFGLSKYRYLALLPSIAFGGFFTYYLIPDLKEGNITFQVYLLSIMSIMFILIFPIILFWRMRTRLYITNYSIEKKTPFHEIKEIKWSDITEVTFNQEAYNISFYSVNQKIKVTTQYAGFNQVLVSIYKKLEPGKYLPSLIQNEKLLNALAQSTNIDDLFE